MNILRISTLAAVVGIATVAVAHDGVENPAVDARMHGMSQIQENMKLLGTMARGGMAFDAAAAQGAAANIAAEAARIPALFQAQETDPKSKAADAIWSNFDDFTARAASLEAAASSAATGITDKNALGAAMGALGGTCGSCHKSYRK